MPKASTFEAVSVSELETSDGPIPSTFFPLTSWLIACRTIFWEAPSIAVTLSEMLEHMTGEDMLSRCFCTLQKGGRKKAPYDKKRRGLWEIALQSGKRALQKAKLLEQEEVDVALGILVLFVGVASELRMFSPGNPLDCHQKCL
jgi:hypothetical protein